MADLQSEMALRITSRRSDEALPLGALLNLDMSQINNVVEAERVQML